MQVPHVFCLYLPLYWWIPIAIHLHHLLSSRPHIHMDVRLPRRHPSRQYRLQRYLYIYSANLGVYLDASTLTKIEACMPFGNGDLISTLTNDLDASNSLNSLSDMII